MKLAKLFKQGPPYSEPRKKLSAAIEAGKIAEETDVPTALQLVFGPSGNVGSYDRHLITVTIMTRGREFGFPVNNGRELLWLLERLDREYELEHEKG